MIEIKRFSDIPQFIRDGAWECNFDIEGVARWIKQEQEELGLQLNPKFQRGHVWTEQQQIAFLEYFFRGGKSGLVCYFNKPDWNDYVPEGVYNEYVCVDGLQRITACLRFANNEIPIFGRYYKDFEDKPRMKHTLRFNVNDLKTEKEVLQWYIDMNVGGTPHTSEEINRVKKMIEKLE